MLISVGKKSIDKMYFIRRGVSSEWLNAVRSMAGGAAPDPTARNIPPCLVRRRAYDHGGEEKEKKVESRLIS